MKWRITRNNYSQLSEVLQIINVNITATSPVLLLTPLSPRSCRAGEEPPPALRTWEADPWAQMWRWWWFWWGTAGSLSSGTPRPPQPAEVWVGPSVGTVCACVSNSCRGGLFPRTGRVGSNWTGSYRRSWRGRWPWRRRWWGSRWARAGGSLSSMSWLRDWPDSWPRQMLRQRTPWLLLRRWRFASFRCCWWRPAGSCRSLSGACRDRRRRSIG